MTDTIQTLCAAARHEAEARRDAQCDELWSADDARVADLLDTLAATLAAKEQEVAELRAQRDVRQEALAEWDARLGRVQDENARLTEQLRLAHIDAVNEATENARLREDAARLDWMEAKGREYDLGDGLDVWLLEGRYRGMDLRAAIDAARAAGSDDCRCGQGDACGPNNCDFMGER